jgi:hypothetical protein
LELPPAFEILNAVQEGVPEKLTRREKGLIGNTYLVIARYLAGAGAVKAGKH